MGVAHLRFAGVRGVARGADCDGEDPGRDQGSFHGQSFLRGGGDFRCPATATRVPTRRCVRTSAVHATRRTERARFRRATDRPRTMRAGSGDQKNGRTNPIEKGVDPESDPSDWRMLVRFRTGFRREFQLDVRSRRPSRSRSIGRKGQGSKRRSNRRQAARKRLRAPVGGRSARRGPGTRQVLQASRVRRDAWRARQFAGFSRRNSGSAPAWRRAAALGACVRSRARAGACARVRACALERARDA